MKAYFFQVASYRPPPLEMHPFHEHLCRAHHDTWPIFSPSDEDAISTGVVINTATFKGVAQIGLRLICADQVAQDIVDSAPRLANARYPVGVTHAYHYPCVPNDTSWLVDSAWDADAELVDSVVSRFVSKYARPVPPEALSLFLVPKLSDMTRMPDDLVEVQVPPSPPAKAYDVEVSTVSPRAIEECGLLWAMGFWCTQQVWDVVGHYLLEPCWFTGAYDL